MKKLSNSKERNIIIAFILLVETILSSGIALVKHYASQFSSNCKKLAEYWVFSSSKQSPKQKPQSRKRSPIISRNLKDLGKESNSYRTEGISYRIHPQTRLDLFTENQYHKADTHNEDYNLKISRPKRAVISDSRFFNPGSSFAEKNGKFVFPQNPPPLGTHSSMKRYLERKSYMASTPLKLEEYNRKNTDYMIQKSIAEQDPQNSNHKKIYFTALPRSLHRQSPNYFSSKGLKHSATARKNYSFQPTELSIIFETLAY